MSLSKVGGGTAQFRQHRWVNSQPISLIEIPDAHALIWIVVARICDKSRFLMLRRMIYLPFLVFNPLMPNGLFYLNSWNMSITFIRGVWLVCIITMICR